MLAGRDAGEGRGAAPGPGQAWGGQLWRGWLVQAGWWERGLRADGDTWWVS